MEQPVNGTIPSYTTTTTPAPSYDELVDKLTAIEAVIGRTEWPPPDRILYIKLLLESRKSADAGGLATWTTLTRESAAHMTGLSAGRAGEGLRKLANQGLIGREQVTTKAGSDFQSYMLTKVPTRPAEIPAKLEDTPRAVKNREDHAAAAAELRRLAEIGREIEALACPSCGVVGDLAIGCQSCGAVYTAESLEIGAPVTTMRLVTVRNPQGDGAAPCHCTENVQLDSLPYDFRTADAADDTEPRAISADEPPVMTPEDVFTGAVTVEYLAELGISLTSVYAPGQVMGNGDRSDGKQPIPPVDDFGAPLGSWRDYPAARADVVNNLERGGNAGMLPGKGNWYVLDVDDGALPDLVDVWPELRLCGLIDRENAPGSGKLLFLMDRSDVPKHNYVGNGRKVELLGAGAHAVIAGTHKTGAPIRFRMFPDRIPVIAHETLHARLMAWAGGAQRTTTTTPPPKMTGTTTSTATTTLSRAEEVRRAIAWWNAQPDNVAKVNALVGNKRYVSVRANDTHPSACRKSTDAFVDYGARMPDGKAAVYDYFEVYARMDPDAARKGKRVVIGEVCRDWRAAGSPD